MLIILLGDKSVSTAFVNNRIIYRIVLSILLIVCILILIHLTPNLFKPEFFPSDDFFHFWGAGNQNLHGENPFDPEKIAQIKLQEGNLSSETYLTSIMLNPPWTISFLMPFGLLSFRISRLTWLIFSTVLLLISSQILWQIYSGKPKQRWLAILVVFIFTPTISVLEKGQLTPLVVIGITGFLYFSVYRRNDWLAGILLTLASIKPQLAIIFWIALLFWVIRKRRWVILISCLITVLLTSLVALIFNPHLLLQYMGMLQTYHLSDWASPTIGAYLRLFWLGVDKFWLQFLPSLLGGLWFIYYWFKHYKTWNWMDELPVLLLVSQLISPYSWTYDLVILIPMLITATIRIITDWKHWSTLLLGVIFIAVNTLDLVLHVKMNEFWFIWMVPALFIWYLIVHWQYPKLPDKLSLSAPTIN
jgi:hypothetical protein